jgi:clan AA aspartic protease (TIGR02281 family)
MKHNNIIALLGFVFLTHYITVFAQPVIDTNLSFNNSKYATYIIKLDSSSVKRISIVPNYSGLSHTEFVEERTHNFGPNMFLINACINDDNGAPLGLLLSNEFEISKTNLADGSGNFFLKPNGVFSVCKNEVHITESNAFSKSHNCTNAVQTGPMLVINNTIHPKFVQGSINKNIRCGVGLYTDKGIKYLVFAESLYQVNFYEFASLFKDHFNCENALCLESANCSTHFPGLGIIDQSEKKYVGSYILYDAELNPRPKTVIKMQKSISGVFEIPVELNGVLKISFIFDTGASDVTISPDVALTLIRTGTITKQDFIGTRTYSFANGETAESDVFVLREVKIGNYIVKNVVASISTSLAAPMLLGQSVMQRLGKFSVDNNNHTLIID